ncbi:SH3 domain-containing protein [Candidatus Electronema sp. TJ]|uniref:SH3 domain-containing protein n=1 Tax=Candidatus Electronema sp. TJ TaxID=3401573 RepID=UPI003AA99681
MKHRTFSAGAGLLLCALLLAASAVSAAEFMSVVKDGVNLRSGPDASSEVFFQLPAGYPLQVIERKGDWINVSDYENDKGWVSASLVSITPYVIVKAERGNIRSGAGPDQPQVGKVVRDVILKKLDQQGDWIKVSHPQLTGWIHKQLVWP